MSPFDVIHKKRDGRKLTSKDIEYMINAYMHNQIPDYQFSAFLMAIYFQGMDFEETTYLTNAMLHSGEMLDLSDIKEPKIDKHSTGGVGDKVSLILAPLVASCGICVPMVSGRGLGHTGGTLDKLESIPNFRINLTIKEFKNQLNKIGVAVIGQTEEIAPADKKIYALRDVTATVDSIPLIASSIMSKKLAEDLDGLVLDVKFGSGAFMQDYKKAKELTRTMIQICRHSGIKVMALLTDMNNPLGEYVGNSLEVIETIEALKGRWSKDLKKITFALGLEMLKIAKIKGGKKLLEKKIENGEALKKFKDIIYHQGGDTRVIDDYSRLPVAKNIIKISAPKTGFIHYIDNQKLGILATQLGAGRMKKDDKIDPSCGFHIHKKIGDFVKKGEVLFDIFSDNPTRAKIVYQEIKHIFLIKNKYHQRRPLIRKISSL